MATAIFLKSSDDTKSNQNRLSLMVDRAKSEGSQYKIFSEIEDKKGNRPLKQDLLSRVYKKDFDTILVYSFSDWADSPVQLYRELSELIASGTKFISCKENFDSSSVTGKLFMQVFLSMHEWEKSLDSPAKEINTSDLKPIDNHPPGNKIAGRRNSQERPAGLNDFRSEVQPTKIDIPGKSLIPKVSPETGKEYTKSEPFDLIGIDEACSLTCYSKHTLYQFTSKKLIPHFKRPHGRRIFFSKRALEEWILTGKI